MVVLAAGCQVRTEVDIEVAEDGSGTVTVSVGLDPDASSRVPGLESELRLDDLVAAGWEIAGPAVEADGYTWIRATKPFGTPEEAGTVLAEIAGEDGPVRDLALTQQRSFARSTFGFEGTVDLTGGLEAFGDDALAALLEGEALGESVDAIEARIGGPLAEAFTLRVAVGLPGNLKSTNAPSSAANGAAWEPSLSDGVVTTLEASSEILRPRTLALVGVAVAAGLAALALALVTPMLNRRRRRRRPKARHAALR